MQLISREEAAKWFADVVPGLANFLLRLPSLLESHYHNADNLLNGVKTGFRLLGPQDAGVVLLGQVVFSSFHKYQFFIGFEFCCKCVMGE